MRGAAGAVVIPLGDGRLVHAALVHASPKLLDLACVSGERMLAARCDARALHHGRWFIARERAEAGPVTAGARQSVIPSRAFERRLRRFVDTGEDTAPRMTLRRARDEHGGRHVIIEKNAALVELERRPQSCVVLTDAATTSLGELVADESIEDVRLLGLTRVDDLSPLLELPNLRAIELAGMWQFEVGALDALLAIPTLRDIRVDIGGRRKNREVYRRWYERRRAGG